MNFLYFSLFLILIRMSSVSSYENGRKEGNEGGYYHGKKESTLTDDYDDNGYGKKHMQHYIDSGGKKGKQSKEDDLPECSVVVARECIGECNNERRNRDLQEVVGDENWMPVEESSIYYRLPEYSGKKTFCLEADPDALCQMISAYADIYVDDYLLAQEVDMSNDDDSYKIQVYPGSSIRVNLYIALDPRIRCIREGSYTYYLASN